MHEASRHTASSKSLIGNTLGEEIAEAALVMPLVFMLLLGIYWFGRLDHRCNS
jgi:hypothetical protein